MEFPPWSPEISPRSGDIKRRRVFFWLAFNSFLSPLFNALHSFNLFQMLSCFILLYSNCIFFIFLDAWMDEHDIIRLLFGCPLILTTAFLRGLTGQACPMAQDQKGHPHRTQICIDWSGTLNLPLWALSYALCLFSPITAIDFFTMLFTVTSPGVAVCACALHVPLGAVSDHLVSS